MSGIKIPCSPDAELPEFIVQCIGPQDVKGPSQEGFQFRDS